LIPTVVVPCNIFSSTLFDIRLPRFEIISMILDPFK